MSKLLLVPTPVGNLRDFTFRAVEVLNSADLILAEDTRQAKKLLNHYGITTPLQSHHKFNEHKTVDSVCSKILAGVKIAVISDAGTPGISDPGFLLVRACIEKGIEIETLPGPTSLIPALINSGLPSDRFCFEGFLPVKKGRNKRLSGLREEQRTMIFLNHPSGLSGLLMIWPEFSVRNALPQFQGSSQKYMKRICVGQLLPWRHITGRNLPGEK